MGWPNPKTPGELRHLADLASRTDIYGHVDPEPLAAWEIPCAVCEVIPPAESWHNQAGIPRHNHEVM